VVIILDAATVVVVDGQVNTVVSDERLAVVEGVEGLRVTLLVVVSDLVVIVD